MKKVVWLLMLASGFAHASDWQILTPGTNYYVFIDKQSLARSGKYRKAWVQYSYTADQSGAAYSGYKTYRSMKSLEYFFCDERTSGSIQQIYYSGEYGSGESVHVVNLTLPQVVFSEVAPDTVGEAMLNYVCKTIPEKTAKPGKI